MLIQTSLHFFYPRRSTILVTPRKWCKDVPHAKLKKVAKNFATPR